MQQRLLTDRLTGLANREAFLRRIEENIMTRRRAGDPRLFAVLFVDLDHFKTINDTHGHDAGDTVLRVCGERMRAAMRESDLVARYAGDEFVVLLDQIDSRKSAERIRMQLQSAITQPIQVRESDPSGVATVGASIGIACYPDEGQDVASLIEYADVDMYRQKNAGRPASLGESQ
jgi:diguanylate cyclase (GGDEF)-like protein